MIVLNEDWWCLDLASRPKSWRTKAQRHFRWHMTGHCWFYNRSRATRRGPILSLLNSHMDNMTPVLSQENIFKYVYVTGTAELYQL